MKEPTVRRRQGPKQRAATGAALNANVDSGNDDIASTSVSVVYAAETNAANRERFEESTMQACRDYAIAVAVTAGHMASGLAVDNVRLEQLKAIGQNCSQLLFLLANTAQEECNCHGDKDPISSDVESSPEVSE